jgi:hypothetical protein
MNDEPALPEDVLSEGEASYQRGLPREDCPYPPGSEERDAWLTDWDRAARRDRSRRDPD